MGEYLKEVQSHLLRSEQKRILFAIDKRNRNKKETYKEQTRNVQEMYVQEIYVLVIMYYARKLLAI